VVQFHEGRKFDKVRVPERDRSNAPLKRSSQIKLGEQPECAADVQRLCSKLGGTNNFAIIDCLQNDNMASILSAVILLVLINLAVPYSVGPTKKRNFIDVGVQKNVT